MDLGTIMWVALSLVSQGPAQQSHLDFVLCCVKNYIVIQISFRSHEPTSWWERGCGGRGTTEEEGGFVCGCVAVVEMSPDSWQSLACLSLPAGRWAWESWHDSGLFLV